MFQNRSKTSLALPLLLVAAILFSGCGRKGDPYPRKELHRQEHKQESKRATAQPAPEGPRG